MQYKSLVDPSFLVLMMDVQAHIQAGWKIDENNYPTANFTYYEVHLIKDDFSDAIKDVFDNPENILGTIVNNDDFGNATVKKAAGRPPKAKP